MTGLISAALGLTQMLPLPALDGGRILFVLIEIVRGRRGGTKVGNGRSSRRHHGLVDSDGLSHHQGHPRSYHAVLSGEQANHETKSSVSHRSYNHPVPGFFGSIVLRLFVAPVVVQTVLECFSDSHYQTQNEDSNDSIGQVQL